MEFLHEKFLSVTAGEESNSAMGVSSYNFIVIWSDTEQLEDHFI